MHYHIFKNAGTTVEWVLAKNFRRKFARLDGKNRFFIITQNELLELLKSRPDIRAISTHTLFPPKPNIDGLHIHDLVLVRHPLDRLMSMYDFYHRANDKSDPLGEAARKLEPEKFFAFLIQKYPHLINNAQVNYLNGGRKIPRDPDLQRAIRDGGCARFEHPAEGSRLFVGVSFSCLAARSSKSLRWRRKTGQRVHE